MLSEIVSRYVKCNSNNGDTELDEQNVRNNALGYMTNLEKKINVLESVILYKNIPYDFCWKEYLDLNKDLKDVIDNEYIAKDNFELYGFHEKRLYKRAQLHNIDVFVYCGGKCAGMTLRNTFQHKQKHTRCLHTHSNEEFKLNYNNCGNIHDLILTNSAFHNKIYIIDSYRTPIERKISSFFQNINIDFPDYASKSMHELMIYFNYQYIYNVDPKQNNEDYHPIDELLEDMGIQEFSDFDFRKKYCVIKHKNLIFIKLRFQNIDKWEEILSEIMGTPITLHSDNFSETKSYYTLYQKFKKEYVVPKTYLESLKTNMAFIKYNSPNERSQYINYWASRSI
jgi:hypothetical protein